MPQKLRLVKRLFRTRSKQCDLITYWLVWIDIKCAVHIALPRWPINQFKPVQQSRHQALKAYCPKIYTVPGVQSSQANNFNEVINSKELLR